MAMEHDGAKELVSQHNAKFSPSPLASPSTAQTPNSLSTTTFPHLEMDGFLAN